jgi:hypothetical protein
MAGRESGYGRQLGVAAAVCDTSILVSQTVLQSFLSSVTVRLRGRLQLQRYRTTTAVVQHVDLLVAS